MCNRVSFNRFRAGYGYECSDQWGNRNSRWKSGHILKR